MNLSMRTLAQARELTTTLLEHLALDAYLFEVEANEDGRWEVRVECPHDEGWQVTTIPVDRDRLLATETDSAARTELLEDWEERLASCRRRGSIRPS